MRSALNAVFSSFNNFPFVVNVLQCLILTCCFILRIRRNNIILWNGFVFCVCFGVAANVIQIFPFKHSRLRSSHTRFRIWDVQSPPRRGTECRGRIIISARRVFNSSVIGTATNGNSGWSLTTGSSSVSSEIDSLVCPPSSVLTSSGDTKCVACLKFSISSKRDKSSVAVTRPCHSIQTTSQE
jgi:hypothetical protein